MSEAPPPYEEAVGSSSGPAGPSSHASRLAPPVPRNGISASTRRSMEDEHRSLPDGWVRQFDAKTSHQYFVDTRQNPPRSIWHHPYDDEEYLQTLPSAERERIQSLHEKMPSVPDIMADDTDDEDGHTHAAHGNGSATTGKNELPPREEKPTGFGKFGRKMKDKMTQSTHQEREAERQKRAEAERKAYQAHQKYRDALQKAMQTGEPQYIGHDKDGKEVYIDTSNSGPTSGPMAGATYQDGRYGQQAYGVNPYHSGPYSNPNARFIRPQQSYQRPYGSGYGGGYGLPLLGGLGGGLLLGDLMFGGMGGGMGMGMGVSSEVTISS